MFVYTLDYSWPIPFPKLTFDPYLSQVTRNLRRVLLDRPTDLYL